ncbi:hypothetical protein PC116_g14787 [Phytophthora cactorum]|uniref:Transmembrane protein n=1 Tax=Phytophthora cactorum TaxID=29920 RepID=A0A329SUH5_9STRA|nr:hypothetical protein PC112_g12247 [Phytophthora cactorum]KAG2821192.1 hypothetical protein PC111_g11139 [Phytophthora cactorum]KAG2855074.1 hypothetical protein PC113_g12756 [Phytophthora cactorum]KAG2932913.1 hypothetical protein PC117_g12985 [Phytophthora cactorum]KAG2978319.1 hypothetical protein PC118_g12348 [Phytophthora cactorum]
MRLALLVQKLVEYWESTQVELRGFYSVERVRELTDYNQRASIFRALVVLVLIPWPCVIITILVDMIPLRPPSEGLGANYLFIVRVFLAFWVATIVINLQFRHSVPTAPLSNKRIIISGAFTAVFTTGVVYALSMAIGFPLPFGIITVSPMWVVFMLIPLLSFLKKARSDPEVWPLVINTLKVWVCQESLVVIYPTYFYIFTTLPADAKSPYAFLLPIIKIFLRNVMSRTVVHLNDEIPEVVLMNVEVFNSLFMSYCMQNTPSIWTTLGLIAIDGAQMIASMHDVAVVIQRLRILKERVNAERARQLLANPTSTQIKILRRKTILVYTQDILDRYKQTAQVSVASTTVTDSSSPSVEILDLKPKTTSFKGVPKQILYSPSTLGRSKGVSLRKIFSVDGAPDKEDITQLELDYAQQVRKVLYITEFMLLINYVEVIVPVIFSANLLVMYYLPNRVYYSQIDSMDDAKLWSTLGNVMLYCFLQLVSLVIMFMLLWHKLHISAVRQLAFVLEKQGEQVQTKLVFWVFYNVQATLQHFASDYTFKFAWLHHTPT